MTGMEQMLMNMLGVKPEQMKAMAEGVQMALVEIRNNSRENLATQKAILAELQRMNGTAPEVAALPAPSEAA